MFKLICFVSLAIFALTSGKSIVDVEADEATNATSRNSDLIAVVQVFRHGQRTPVFYYPNDPYSDSSYWDGLATGQLTNEGKRQHYELGTFTRRRYSDFLPRRYNNVDFKAQTTDVDRTHMSAQSNVAAIFPPRGSDVWKRFLYWQPIPIHPSDPDIINTGPDCAIYNAESTNVQTNAPEFVEINKKYADVYAYLAENSGLPVTSVQMAYLIYDSLMIENQVGLKLPSWTDTVFQEPLRTITALAFTSFSYTDTQKRLMAGRWLYEVAEYFTQMAEDSTSSQKYQLYSAHDSNVAAILNTLGAFRPHYPSFASSIYFELRNKKGKKVINIWHRNDRVFEKVTVKGCSFDCSIDEFKSVLSTWLVDADAWAAECALNSTSFTDINKVKNSPETAELHKQMVAHFNRLRPAHKQLKH